MKLAVAIPAYNEELMIAKTLSNIRNSLHKEENLIIIVVDDGSTDNTTEVALKSGADFVICHKKNLGVAQAYRTAIRAGLQSDADVICTIDADQQFDPKEIPRLVRLVREGRADLVLGSRFLHTENDTRVPVFNRVANRALAHVVSMVIGKYLYDTETGFRAISKRAATDLNLLGIVSFSSDMIIDVSKRGLEIAEVPVSVTYYANRVSRVTKSFIKYGFKSLCLIVMKLISYLYPFNFLSSNLPEIEIIQREQRRDERYLTGTQTNKQLVSIES